MFEEKKKFWENDVLINLHDEAPKQGGLLELRNTETKTIIGAKLLGKLFKAQNTIENDKNWKG